MRIIPAIDIINGKCVRLSKGNYSSKKVYDKNPIDFAKEVENAGIKHLHVVDLEGAKSNKIINHKVLYKICKNTQLKVDFGGGIKSNEAIQIAFESGVHQVTVGSIAVKNPSLVEQWIHQYGSNKIILGADCIDQKIATHGWLNTTELNVIDFIKNYEKRNISSVICTDISKDGMLNGCALDLYQSIIENTQIKLIASGGVSSIADLKNLEQLGCEGAIVGKALYEGKITLNDLELYVKE